MEALERRKQRQAQHVHDQRLADAGSHQAEQVHGHVDVYKRQVEHHADDGRYRELQQQPAYPLRPQPVSYTHLNGEALAPVDIVPEPSRPIPDTPLLKYGTQEAGQNQIR